jgi:hypothetical protein
MRLYPHSCNNIIQFKPSGSSASPSPFGGVMRKRKNLISSHKLDLRTRSKLYATVVIFAAFLGEILLMFGAFGVIMLWIVAGSK